MSMHFVVKSDKGVRATRSWFAAKWYEFTLGFNFKTGRPISLLTVETDCEQVIQHLQNVSMRTLLAHQTNQQRQLL